jgi:hypothetical protein
MGKAARFFLWVLGTLVAQLIGMAGQRIGDGLGAGVGGG